MSPKNMPTVQKGGFLMFEFQKKPEKKLQNKKTASSKTIQRQSACHYTPHTLKCYIDDETTTTNTVGINSEVYIDGGGVTTGSAPYDGRDGIYYYLDGYKKGHIVNQDLGGDGVASNLFPFSAGTNANHYTAIERYAKGAYSAFLNNHRPDERFYYHCWLTGDAISDEPLGSPEEVDDIEIHGEWRIVDSANHWRNVNDINHRVEDPDPDYVP